MSKFDSLSAITIVGLFNPLLVKVCVVSIGFIISLSYPCGDGDLNATEEKLITLNISSNAGVESGPNCGIILDNIGVVVVVLRRENNDGGNDGKLPTPAGTGGILPNAGDGVLIRSCGGVAYDSR